ncbi:bifunctional lysine-specific demethylase and histidyl-hydroxylase no66 [Phtheirospermum japonicum]|uniref:Bifunctional lysine-specific demethylase and histidyl-hydroxylase n=1 Tax=Phtheirospermum japonicum TaxID=374723 RepID=A0A830CCH9_9LAMI|nr:bifunctional lysine-specific demethylase and histidyl-hydroxylase no66 [Phtheirospermum japonicum]
MKSKARISTTMKKKKEKRRNTVHQKTLFPLILAALYSKPRIRRTLIKKCLSKVSISLPHVELSPILALLPSLLKSNCAEIVCKSAEIIGAASLASFEMNEKIALEDEIVKRLISLFRSSEREIAIASCNAVLDLSTTFVGQQRLLEFSAIENLIFCFIQECKSSIVYPDMTLLEKDEYLILLLQGVIALINSCSIEQLQHIPLELSDKFSILLKRIWKQAHFYPEEEFCIKIASDELNILQVIKDIKNNLGYRIIYHQDIRVVKTESGEKEELHYFQKQSNSSCSLDPPIFSVNDLSNCEIAFKEGYSIALRGIEFRDQNIAAIADGLASIFGQPSVGVNMYMTPSNSQGLARHSDDHCVFVCQIMGAKRWKVFRRPDFKLPRLYESCDSLRDLEEDKSAKFDGCQEFVLKEGDVLYIPRGCPHEAVTDNMLQFNSVACSPHLASLMLLHIAIELIGPHDLRFRKACLVGAMPLSSETRDWLCENQKTTCGYLISTVISECKFSDTFEHLKAALEINVDPLEHLRWIKCLEEEEEIDRSESLRISWPDVRDVFDVLSRNMDIAEAAFVQVKSRFCREVEFEDVKRYYQVLLEKYRKVRKQYANGMLALHSALRDEHEFSS